MGELPIERLVAQLDYLCIDHWIFVLYPINRETRYSTVLGEEVNTASYVLIIHSHIESDTTMIQFNIQFKIKYGVFIQ